MVLRIRWFVVGALTSLGIVGYLANQLRKARERITPGNLARSGARGIATWLEEAADVVRPEQGPR